jgi:hypothetical protein
VDGRRLHADKSCWRATSPVTLRTPAPPFGRMLLLGNGATLDRSISYPPRSLTPLPVLP